MEYDAVDSSLRSRYGTAMVPVPTNDITRYTSMHGLLRTGQTYSQLIFSQANKIWGQDAGGSTNYQLLNDAFTIANDTFWQWVTFDDFAIGCNGDTVNTNPVYWDGISGDAVALAGSPPNGKFCAVWNGRVFMSVGDTLYYCKLGDPEDWTATGVSGAGNISFYKANEDITGIAAHRERLFVFFRRSIYQIVTANPNTDTSKWRVEIFSRDGGCLSGYTIQAFRNDLIFLSDDGFASMNALETWGDFDRALISKKVNVPINHTRDTYASGVRPDVEQYWCALGSGATNDYVFVLDYSAEQQPRWTKFQFRKVDNGVPFGDDGILPISGMTIVYWDGGVPYFILGGSTATTTAPFVWTIRYPYISDLRDCVHSNGGVDPEFRFKTKAYALDSPLIQKIANKFGLALKAPDGQIGLAVDLTYIFDQDSFKTKTVEYNFDINLISFQKNVAAWKKFSGDPGRRFREIQFEIERNAVNAPRTGFIFKELMFDAVPLNHRHVGDL